MEDIRATTPYKLTKRVSLYSRVMFALFVRKILLCQNLNNLTGLKLIEMSDLLQSIKIEKFLNKTQRAIIDALKRHGGYAIQKELLQEINISERSFIENIKKLEDYYILY